MKLTRLRDYKSRIPVTLEKKARKDCRIFRSDELNRMIDGNIGLVRRDGYAKLVVPPRLHPIRPKFISENARKVAKVLLEAGFHAYLCGGAVRDLVREEEVNDFDITTDASIGQLEALFDGIRFISIPGGLRFGYLEFAGDVVDVATFCNIPAAYKGLPHIPEFDGNELYSGSLLFDAFQRDMSINMLYYDFATGDVVDFFGGLYCLREGIVSAVIPDGELFRIDPRRAIRFIRFAARFGFGLSAPADAALRAKAPEYMRKLDGDTVAMELPDFFAGGYARRGTELLLEYKAFGELFPAVREKTGTPAYVEYALRTALGADWLYEEGTWALPMIVMAALLWPAVRDARKAGAENPAEQVLRSQRSVMAMSDTDAAYFLSILAMAEDESRDGADVRAETLEIFGKPEFREGLEMLRLHYLSRRDKL